MNILNINCTRDPKWLLSIKQSALATLIVPLLLAGICPAKADKNEDALRLITDTADRICGNIAPTGQSQSVEVKGNIKGQLNGLVSKLADLGVSGDASIKSDSFASVLQTDLPKTLDQVRECKLKVFDKLEAKLVFTKSESIELKQQAFEVFGSDVSFGCTEGNTSSVSYSAPPGYRILNSFVAAHDVKSAKFNNPSIDQSNPHKVTAAVYFHGRDREWTGNCPGGGHGKVRLYGTIIKE